MNLTPFCTPCRSGSHSDCYGTCSCTHSFGNGSEARISDRLVFALRYLELAAVELQEFAPPELADKRESLKRSLNSLHSTRDMLWYQLGQKGKAA